MIILASLLCILPLLTHAQNNRCDPATCQLPRCHCPSPNPPKGLDPKSIPQFMTLTFDDDVTPVLWDRLQQTFANHRNPNACPLSSTFFVSSNYTDFWLLQRLYAQGHEVATHTITHPARAPREEIVGARTMYNAFAGVPMDKITGFRHPFLNFSSAQFTTLRDTGFQYDSSMAYHPIQNNVWPYTLDNGPAYPCYPGICDGNFVFPGLWEIPLYSLLNNDGTLNAAMDPNPVGIISKEATVNLLKSNFERTYSSNRRPMGVYLHAASMNVEGIIEFIQWTQSSFKDVYWINNQQLLAWMNNPTDITGSLTNPALDCQMPARNPSNREICDGMDNTGNGEVDAGLVQSCPNGRGGNFRTCFGCPASPPSTQNPAPPPADGNTRRRIGNSCPNDGIFDPLTGNCVTLQREAKPAIDPAKTDGDVQTAIKQQKDNNKGDNKDQSNKPPNKNQAASISASPYLFTGALLLFGLAVYFQ